MKTAIVTGASRGIGRAVLEKLLDEGYTVVANCYKNPQLLEDINSTPPVSASANEGNNNVMSRGTCIIHTGDVSDDGYCRELVEYAVSKFGHIDVLVNNAGICISGLVQDIDYQTFRKEMDTNFSSVYSMCRYVVPYMLQKANGCIVNVSSVWAQTGAACDSVYSASKGAIESFTKSIAAELESASIRVNAIAPGAVDTDMNRVYSEKEIQELIKEIPLGRMYQPDEVAEEIYKIITADYTGQIIKFDGGWT